MSTNYNSKIVTDGLILCLDAANEKSYPFDWIKTVFITTTGAGTFTIPSDFSSLVSIEAIGAGAGTNTVSLGGGGGGAYAKSTSVTGLVAGGTSYYFIPPGVTNISGGDTWFNATSNSAPTLSSEGVLAKGGTINPSTVGGAGGQASLSVGDLKFSGGQGGSSTISNGGGGGAAGPLGNGGAGGFGTTEGNGAGGGGGANAGEAGGNSTVNTGGKGGNSSNGIGGLGATSTSAATSGTNGGGGGGGWTGSNINGASGGNGSIWTQTSNGAVAGPGGGAGAGFTGGASIPSGGLYGGGLGNGAVFSGTSGQGIIVFTYIDNTTGWKDTSGNQNNCTIDASGFTYNSSGNFSMADGGISKTGTMNTSTTCTCVFWIKTTDAQALFWGSTVSNSYFLGAYRVSNKFYNNLCGSPILFIDTIPKENIYDNIRDDQWHMVEFKSVDFSAWTNYTFNKYSTFTFGNGNIAYLMIYNKNLSSDESNQNFSALRGRFGI